MIVGGEGGGRWTGGFGRQILRAPLLSLFVGQRLRPVIYEECAEDLKALRERIEAGEVTPVVARTFPLAGAAEAIRFMHDGGAGGKVVLTVDRCVRRRCPAEHADDAREIGKWLFAYRLRIGRCFRSTGCPGPPGDSRRAPRPGRPDAVRALLTG